MLFNERPDLSGYGIKRLPFLYAQSLWPRGTFPGAPEQPDEATIRKTVSQFKAGDLVAVDIEHWPVSRLFGTPVKEIEENVQKFKRVADIMHDEVPGLNVGFYAFIPGRNYWAPVRYNPANPATHAPMRQWQEDNARLQVVPIDATFPSLYTFYGAVDDPNYMNNWVKYAKANIAEAKKYGRPVYPIIWYVYHDSNRRIAGKPIAADFWRLQLETLKEAGADGVVLWGGWKQSWDQNAPWWVATKKFIADLAQPAPLANKP